MTKPARLLVSANATSCSSFACKLEQLVCSLVDAAGAEAAASAASAAASPREAMRAPQPLAVVKAARHSPRCCSRQVA